MKDSNIPSSTLFQRFLGISTEFALWSSSEVEITRKHVNQHTSILDLGCGWGRFVKKFQPICKRIVGLDVDFNEIKEAKRYVGDFQNVLLTVQDGRATGFKCKSFDTIIMMGNVFGNIDNHSRQRILDETVKLITTNGKILISAYSDKSTDFRVKMYKKAGLTINSVSKGKVEFKNSWFSEDFNKIDFLEIVERPQINVIFHDIDNIGFVAEMSLKSEYRK